MKILRVKGVEYMVHKVDLDEEKGGSELEPYVQARRTY